MTTQRKWIVSAVPNYRELDFREGCPFGPVTHGALFHAWQSMLRAAYCREDLTAAELLNDPVCFSWRSFRPFVEWAQLTGFKGAAQLKKRDESESYRPSNCYWEPIHQPKLPKARRFRRASLPPEALADIKRRFEEWESDVYTIARFYGLQESTVEAVLGIAPATESSSPVTSQTLPLRSPEGTPATVCSLRQTACMRPPTPEEPQRDCRPASGSPH